MSDEPAHRAASRKARLVKILVPLGLVLLGVVLFVALVATRSEPETDPRPERVVPVDVITVQPENVRALVAARGQVEPAQSVDLEAEVSGRVVWVSKELMPGGRLREGQPLLRIDPSDYRLAVEAQRGEVSQAEVQLKQERARHEVSERAWERYHARREGADPEPEADSALARNLPQVAAAERALEGARSRLEQAELELSRTTVYAPFNASVVSEQVSLGRRVAPGQVIATLAGTDAYWVTVSVDVGELGLLQVPRGDQSSSGSRALISFVSGRGRTEQSGRVLRLLETLDAEGSMARVLVQVDDPLGVSGADERRGEQSPGPQGPPLLLGAFVDVQIEGELLEGVFVLPEEVLHQDDRVWVVDAEERLREREVGVVRHQADTVIVSEGLESGERVVRSHLPLAIPGMRVEARERRAEREPGVRSRQKGQAPR